MGKRFVFQNYVMMNCKLNLKNSLGQSTILSNLACVTYLEKETILNHQILHTAQAQQLLFYFWKKKFQLGVRDLQ